MLVFIFTCSKKNAAGHILYSIPMRVAQSPCGQCPHLLVLESMGVGCTVFDFLCRFWGHPVSNIPMPNKTCQNPCLRVLFQFSQQLAVQWLTGQTSHFFGISKRSGFEMGLFGNPLSSVPLSKKSITDSTTSGGLISVPKAAPPAVALHSHFVLVLAAGAAELVEGTGSNVLDSTGLAFAVVEVVAAQLAIASVVLAASVLASVEPAFAVVAFAVLAIAATAVVAVAASGGLAVCWASITHVSCKWQEQMVIKSIPCILSAQLHWSLKATWNEIDGLQKRSRDSEK